MAQTAAHLVDRVLPEVPVRQWVLTLPYPPRYRCAWNARLTGEVLRCFLRAVFADQRRRAKRDLGIRRGGCGSVTFIQRFGSALNLTPHFHTLVLDGVYAGTSSQPGPLAPLPPPETEDVARVLAGTARRILRRLERKGITMEEDPLAADDPLMAMLGAASGPIADRDRPRGGRSVASSRGPGGADGRRGGGRRGAGVQGPTALCATRRNEPPRRRGRARARSETTRAVVSIRGASAPRARAAPGDDRWETRRSGA